MNKLDHIINLVKMRQYCWLAVRTVNRWHFVMCCLALKPRQQVCLNRSQQQICQGSVV